MKAPLTPVPVVVSAPAVSLSCFKPVVVSAPAVSLCCFEPVVTPSLNSVQFLLCPFSTSGSNCGSCSDFKCSPARAVPNVSIWF